MRQLLFTLVTSLLTLSASADVPLGHKDFVPSPQHPVGWRGDGTGVFPGATPPTSWDSSGKGVLWRVTMPHQTLASPIVVKGKVITLADPHTILACDANTGKRLWFNAQNTFDLLCKDAAEVGRFARGEPLENEITAGMLRTTA